MSLKLSDATILKLQEKYSYLTNFQSVDPTAPIDPINYRDAGGDNLLHIAAQLGDFNTVELLVKAGLKIDALGEMGFTPLHYAYQNKHSDIVAFLMENGAPQYLINYFGKVTGDYDN